MSPPKKKRKQESCLVASAEPVKQKSTGSKRPKDLVLQVSPTDTKQQPDMSSGFIRRSGRHRNARIEPNQVFEACKNYLDLQKPKNEVLLSSSYMVNHVAGMFRVALTYQERSKELSDQAGEPDPNYR